MKPSKTYLIILIILLSIFAPISTDMFLSGLPQMIIDLDTNESIITMVLYGFMFSLAICVLFVGPISDKYGRKPLLLVSMTVYTLMSIACSLAGNVWVLIIARVIQAIGAAGALSASMALIKDCFSGEDMTKVLSIVAALGIIGPIAAPIVGTALIETMDWRATFWAPALVSGACLLMTIPIPETMDEKYRYTGTILGSFGKLRDILSVKEFTLFTILSSAFYIPFFAYLGVSSYIYQNFFGFSRTEYSIMLAVTALAGVIGMLVLQKVTKKIGNKNTVIVFFFLGTISFLIMLFAGDISPYVFMIAIMLCAFVSMSTRPFGYNILMRQFEGDNGSVSSILNFATFMMGVIGMLIASLPWESFITGMAFCLLIAVVIHGVMYILMHKSKGRLKGLEDL